MQPLYSSTASKTFNEPDEVPRLTLRIQLWTEAAAGDEKKGGRRVWLDHSPHVMRLD
jgi:hypothetical protein